MNSVKLGKLEKGDLRIVWPHEALDFTNWLALEENLKLLSEEIGIDIKLVQTEAPTGNFFCRYTCRRRKYWTQSNY